MTSRIKRTLHTLRALLGWNEISDRRLTPGHGWLLPPAACSEPGAVAPVQVPSRAASSQRG